jgi:hypothetical protein
MWTIGLGPLLSRRTVYAHCLTELYMIGGSNSSQPSPLHQQDYFPYLSLLRSKNALKLSSFPSVPLSFGMCLLKWWLYLQLVLFITVLLPQVQAWFITVQCLWMFTISECVKALFTLKGYSYTHIWTYLYHVWSIFKASCWRSKFYQLLPAMSFYVLIMYFISLYWSQSWKFFITLHINRPK